MITTWQVFVLWLPWYAVCFWNELLNQGGSEWFSGVHMGLNLSRTSLYITDWEGHNLHRRTCWWLTWQGGSIKARDGLHNALFPNLLKTNTRLGRSSLWTEASSRLSKSGHILEINHSTEFPQCYKVESLGMEQAIPTSSSMPIFMSARFLSHVTTDFSLYCKHFLHPDKTVSLGEFLNKIMTSWNYLWWFLSSLISSSLQSYMCVVKTSQSELPHCARDQDTFNCSLSN